MGLCPLAVRIFADCILISVFFIAERYKAH